MQLSPAASMTASVPNTARMLPAARCMCSIVPLGWGTGAGQGQRRDGIAQEFHFAAGERRSKVIAPCATDRIDRSGRSDARTTWMRPLFGDALSRSADMDTPSAWTSADSVERVGDLAPRSMSEIIEEETPLLVASSRNVSPSCSRRLVRESKFALIPNGITGRRFRSLNYCRSAPSESYTHKRSYNGSEGKFAQTCSLKFARVAGPIISRFSRADCATRRARNIRCRCGCAFPPARRWRPEGPCIGRPICRQTLQSGR